MQCLCLLATLIASGLALNLAPAHATDYATTPTPACRLMRNVTPGAPHLPEPNRDDTREAMQLGGAAKSPLDHEPMFRRRFAAAFELMRKIDAGGTAALSELPPDTPRIDLLIDRHVANLAWARAMLGVFYEEGRASRIDYQQAADFYQKSIDTRFVDDRGCVHSWPADTGTLTHLAGLAYYGVSGVPQDRPRARALLVQAGTKAAPILYLLDKNALPETYAAYLATNFDELAEAVKNPPPRPLFSWLMGNGMDDAAIIGLLGRILLWCAVVVALFVGGVGLFRYVRRKQGYKDEASFYRTLFAVYDVIHHILARFGLVAEGLIGCFVGLSILAGGFFFISLGTGYDAIIAVSGLSSFLGGIAKLIEAARLSTVPANTRVHGAARPAAEPEAKAAARGDAKTGNLHDRTFSE